ncbi:MAG: AraC family transcriptional regulator [Opitutales bacterium]|nr:MAG: AraC family transcriptional regulator [Opitutales bacterium]
MSGIALSRRFFAHISYEKSGLEALFEHIPGVFFLVKDSQGRFMAGNRATRERLGADTPERFLGKTDADFVPGKLVRDFREDDAQVLRTGKPIVNRLESWLDEQRQLRWFLTTKLPLFDKHGRPIGVMAVIRRHEAERTAEPANETTRAVAFVKANLRQRFSVRELARAAGCSERSLHRKIVASMGVTPHELVLRLRTEAAAQRLLSTDEPIASIAVSHGFFDQSAFTRHFRQRTGLAPRKFRLSHQGLME